MLGCVAGGGCTPVNNTDMVPSRGVYNRNSVFSLGNRKKWLVNFHLDFPCGKSLSQKGVNNSCSTSGFKYSSDAASIYNYSSL